MCAGCAFAVALCLCWCVVPIRGASTGHAGWGGLPAGLHCCIALRAAGRYRRGLCAEPSARSNACKVMYTQSSVAQCDRCAIRSAILMPRRTRLEFVSGSSNIAKHTTTETRWHTVYVNQDLWHVRSKNWSLRRSDNRIDCISQQVIIVANM